MQQYEMAWKKITNMYRNEIASFPSQICAFQHCINFYHIIWSVKIIPNVEDIKEYHNPTSYKRYTC